MTATQFRLKPADPAPIIGSVDEAEDLNALLIAWDAMEPVQTCPRCGYPGLQYDAEFTAYVHDYCGYWRDK